MSASVKQLLEDQGVAISMIELMEYADDRILSGEGDAKCIDVFSRFAAEND